MLLTFMKRPQRVGESVICSVACAEAQGTDTGSQTLRSFAYQAIGQLAQRAPELLQEQTAIAAQFFAALTAEPPGVRAAVQGAVSTLATAYTGCSGKQDA